MSLGPHQIIGRAPNVVASVLGHALPAAPSAKSVRYEIAKKENAAFRLYATAALMRRYLRGGLTGAQ
jgi:hypothetical protein